MFGGNVLKLIIKGNMPMPYSLFISSLPVRDAKEDKIWQLFILSRQQVSLYRVTLDNQRLTLHPWPRKCLLDPWLRITSGFIRGDPVPNLLAWSLPGTGTQFAKVPKAAFQNFYSSPTKTSWPELPFTESVFFWALLWTPPLRWTYVGICGPF